MGGIVDVLYSKPQADGFRQLWKDEEARPALRAAIGQELMFRDDLIILQPAIDTLMVLCSTSHFAESAEECAAVAVLVHKGLRYPEILPQISDAIQPKPRVRRDFAMKALISLSFFSGALERQCRRHGAPQPDFYRQLSQACFIYLGHEQVARNHQHWESFLAEKLGA